MKDGKKPSERYQELRKQNCESIQKQIDEQGRTDFDTDKILLFASSKALCDVLDEMEEYLKEGIRSTGIGFGFSSWD